jgi:aryl-alcohol dehydrogenase-like predicted oxidoreductase
VDRRHLGSTGILVPAIGMGTWRTFDTDEDRRPIVEEALAAGINFFDSSPMYGKAEEVLARSLGGHRDEVLIATKVWTEDEAEGRRQIDHALALFGTVDVYQVHNLVNVPAHLPRLEELKDEGKVKAIGATHYQESQFGRLEELMRAGRLDTIQVPYNPLRQEAGRSILPLAEELGIGVFVMSPLQSGILDRRPAQSQLAELGVQSWAQAILKWIASDARVSTVLTATKTPDRPTENARAGEPPIFTPEQRRLVESICAVG